MPLRAGLILARETRTLGSVGLLRSDDGRILLVRTFYRTDWGLPGGYLKRRETPDDGLRRELGEEIGLDVSPGREPWVVFQPNRRHVDFVYLIEATAADVAGAAPASWEIVELAWFDLTSLPPLQPEAVSALAAAGLAP